MELARYFGTPSTDVNTRSVTISTPGGIVPSVAGWNIFYTGGVGNGMLATAGTDVVPVAGSIYWAQLYIPHNIPVTGIVVTLGTVGGTDKFLVCLHDSTGVKLANSATAGVTAGTAATKQSIPFTAAYSAIGPAPYYVSLQSNGTTARFRAFGVTGEPFVTGSTTGVFGTVGNLTVGATYTASVGPIASTY